MVSTRAQSLCVKIGEVLQGTKKRAWAMDECDVCGVFTTNRWKLPNTHQNFGKEVNRAIIEAQEKRVERVTKEELAPWKPPPTPTKTLDGKGEVQVQEEQREAKVRTEGGKQKRDRRGEKKSVEESTKSPTASQGELYKEPEK